jgi:hypothetical protein
MFENAVTYQFIGNVTNSATDDTTLGTAIAVGSVALIKVDGSSSHGKVQESDMTSSAAGVKFKIVQKTAGGQLIYSPEFEIPKTSISGVSYTAPAEQVSTWGYNGTDGSLGTITPGSDYILHISLLNYAPGVGTTPLIKTVPYTATAGTEENVAFGLAQSFDRIFGREPNKTIQCDVISDDTSVDSSGGVFSVTQGSNVVTTVESSGAAGDAAKYDTDGSTIVVGDLIRFTAASESTADPVYKVTAISGGGTAAATITLDRKYKGATNASYAANAVGVIAAATAAAGEYGLKFTGLDRFADSGFDPASDFYSKVRFKVASDDFDTAAEFRTGTPASEGTGSAYEVAQMEYFCAKNEGLGTRVSAYPPTKTRTEADLSTPGTYDTITLECYDNSMVDVATGLQPVSKFTILIRTKVALTGDAVDAAFGLTL